MSPTLVSMTENSKQPGFTLIEMLVAMVMIVTIVSMVYGSYAATSEAQGIYDSRLTCSGRAQLVLRLMSRQIRCAYVPADEPNATEPAKGTEQIQNRADREIFFGDTRNPRGEFLRFVTTAGLGHTLDTQRGLSRIRYKYDSRERALSIAYDPYEKQQSKAKQQVASWTRILDGVTEIEIAFHDGKQWQSQWRDRRTLETAQGCEDHLENGGFERSRTPVQHGRAYSLPDESDSCCFHAEEEGPVMKSRVRHHNRQDGFVLILVLGLVMLLSGLLFAFNLRTQRTMDVAETFRGSELARSCARAGLGIATAAIAEVNDLEADPRLEGLRTGKQTFEVGDGTCSVTIVDESGRINVNTLKERDGKVNRTQIDRLLKLIDLLNRRMSDRERISYSVVPALIDWVDEDDEITHLPFISPGGLGAENSYYQGLTPAYRCSNEPMDAIEELCQVKGMTPEGFDLLQDYLTTVGDGQVNINAAPLLVIQSLTEQMDPALAQMIVRQRQRKPFANVTELRGVPGMTDNVFEAIKDSITVQPEERIYRVSSLGSVNNRTCRFEAIMRRNIDAGNVDIILCREW